MTMSEDDLRSVLARAPQPRPAPGLGTAVAATARERRARRRAVVASGVAVVAVASTVSVAGLIGQGDKRPPVIQRPDSGVVAPQCDAQYEQSVDGGPAVPMGAVAARLCGVALHLDPGLAVWPDDVIDGPAVADLVEHINDLTPYVAPQICTEPLAPSFDLVLAYPDGRQVHLHGDRSGNCANLAVEGGRQWARPGDVLQRALTLIQDERAVDTPMDAVAPTCPATIAESRTTLEAAPVSATSDIAITLCRYRPTGELQTSAAVAAPETLVRLMTRGSTEQRCQTASDDAERGRELVVVQDAHGDQVTATTQRCRPSSVTGTYRYPTASFIAKVVQLLDAAE